MSESQSPSERGLALSGEVRYRAGHCPLCGISDEYLGNDAACGRHIGKRGCLQPPIYVPAEELEAIVARWEPDTDPASHFRYALCADCGKPIDGPMYHVWHPDRVREIHLCRDCGAKWPTTP